VNASRLGDVGKSEAVIGGADDVKQDQRALDRLRRFWLRVSAACHRPSLAFNSCVNFTL
jgi:hypothetical protein